MHCWKESFSKYKSEYIVGRISESMIDNLIMVLRDNMMKEIDHKRIPYRRFNSLYSEI